MPEARAVRLLPQSLLGRISLVMVAGVLATQVAGSLVWTAQLRARDRADVEAASQYVAHGAANTIRFFRSVPADYRPLLLQQFREMGGTRFFVSLDSAEVPVTPIGRSDLAELAASAAGAALRADVPELPQLRIAFAWPDALAVSPQGTRMTDLPENWVRHILLAGPARAPILVLQTELEPGHWLYLATLMPNPYFLETADPFAPDRLALQGASLAAVLLLSILVVLPWITRPLAALSDAAEAFGTDEKVPALPRSGSREFLRTASAFAAMRERIGRYVEDRERLFISISHDLRTPITRLKLRSELLEDEVLRNE